jgi:2-polyprenyl-6-methoxyphenol hydroxylase-like FAD-dependent oxidoreductase
VSEDDLYLYLLQNRASDERPPRDRWVELLRADLAGYDATVDGIRGTIDDAKVVDYRGLIALLLPEPWHRGRVVLVGDAAHTTTPHLAYGIGLAVEDGIVLAEELSRDEGVDQALARFTARRFERCQLVVENSILLGEWEQNPGTPGADPGRVVGETFAAVARPL